VIGPSSFIRGVYVAGARLLEIALDIDGCISEYPAFFRTLSHAMCGSCHVVVLTNRSAVLRSRHAAA
jgi:hypothetical protein